MKVLLIGATGYIGRRLIIKLLNEKDVGLRLFVRDARRLDVYAGQSIEVEEGDAFSEEDLKRAVKGIDVAYYPIRFFSVGREFEETHRNFAKMFRDACISAGVKKIIYLGFLGSRNRKDSLFKNMMETGEILIASPEKIQTVWLRTGFVIGSGSALFEVLRNLVQKVPLLLIPQWMNTKTKPVGITNLLEYLVQAKAPEVNSNLVVDIGTEEMSFQDMLKETVGIMGLRRLFVPFPFSAHRLFSFLLMLVTPFSYTLSYLLIQALKSGNVQHDDTRHDNAQRYFPMVSPLPFRQAFEKALGAIERDQVISRWTDSLAGSSHTDPEDEITRAVYRDIKRMDFGMVLREKIFRAVKSIGGEEGWFTFDILWKIRGFMDKLTGGYGISIGRRAGSDLRIGDILDVWKVVDLKENERLLLEVQMKVAGKAWLEFKIEGNTLVQTAYHYPKGLLGRLYWYSMLPFHFFIFRDMIKHIIQRARELD
jgi:uncharacterized protein YbjT (DUF2867 family)